MMCLICLINFERSIKLIVRIKSEYTLCDECFVSMSYYCLMSVGNYSVHKIE